MTSPSLNMKKFYDFSIVEGGKPIKQTKLLLDVSLTLTQAVKHLFDEVYGGTKASPVNIDSSNNPTSTESRRDSMFTALPVNIEDSSNNPSVKARRDSMFAAAAPVNIEDSSNNNPSVVPRRDMFSFDLDDEKKEDDGDADNILLLGRYDEFFSRVFSIKCNKVGLEQFLGSEWACLERIHSSSTPIEKQVITVSVSPVDAINLTGTTQKKEPDNTFAVMMRCARKPVQFLFLSKEQEQKMEYRPHFDVQVLAVLFAYFQEEQIGFTTTEQHDELHKAVHGIKNALCFVSKHWGKFFRGKNFPDYPNSCNHLVKLAATCTRQ
jgi:hypothetical protein